MRLKHYAIHTERSCSDWIKRFILFHSMNVLVFLHKRVLKQGGTGSDDGRFQKRQCHNVGIQFGGYA